MSAAYLDLRLTPNRSLSPRHAWWLVGGVAAVFFAGGLRMLVLGAWPVVPFMLADIALLGWALRASYRSGRAYELVRLDAADLTVAKVSHHGQERRFRFEPFWARVQLETLGEDENRLWVTGNGGRVAVGSFLSPAERVELHQVIADGLARYRRS